MDPLKTLGTLTCSLLLTLSLVNTSAAIGTPDPAHAVPTGGGSGDIFIFDDYSGYHAEQEAADNLLLAYTTTDDPCELREAAESGSPSLIIVNSVWEILSNCDSEDIFPALTAYAEGDGELLFQSWELDLCGTAQGKAWDIQCTDESVADLLGALGAEPGFETYTDAPVLTTTHTASACSIGINPILPAGLEVIEPTNNPAIRVAQGAAGGDGLVCLEDQNGAAQLVVNDNGAYLGFTAPSYEGARDTTLPGPEDMVKLYENLILTYVA